MKRNWTRRKFLESTLKGSVAVSGAVTAGIINPAGGRAGYTGQQSSDTFDVQQRDLLRAAMDEIIPAAGGMPSASEVGGVEYLARIAHENPKVRKDLLHSLGMLSELSRKRQGKEFTSLSHPGRVEALKKFEALRPRQNFAKLRDYVYEAYYTQPKVWTQLGYSFHPTNLAGPRMKPFDPSSLDRVRKMGKLYREVS